MIRTQQALESAERQLAENIRVAKAQRAAFEAEGLSAEQIERLLEPLHYFHAELKADIEGYKDAVAGNVMPIYGVQSIGRYLIYARIAAGMTQRELAGALGVDESVVSHDERNEYHAVRADKAQRILDAIGHQAVLIPVTTWDKVQGAAPETWWRSPASGFLSAIEGGRTASSSHSTEIAPATATAGMATSGVAYARAR